KLCRAHAPGRIAEHRVKGGTQRPVDFWHRGRNAKPGERSDAMPGALGGDTAGDDAAVMVEVGSNVERDAVIADPMAHADADRGDLVVAAALSSDPHADSPVAPLAPDGKACQRPYDPLLEPPDMA